MVDSNIATFVRQFSAEYGSSVESVLYYPHPLIQHGLVLVFANGVSNLIDLVGAAQQKAPTGLSLHCLRRRELFKLALPGIFAPPFMVNERPHLPYFLNRKGMVLFGRDYRGVVQPTAVPGELLAGHIEGCMDSLRRYGILPALLREKYGELAAMLERETLHLMSTALLLHDQWDVSLDTLPELFWRYFPDERLKEIWRKLEKGLQQIDENASATAYHMVWLFERFLNRLEEYVP
ncbi:MAG: hypothetical protein GY803_15160 [Chloroflexi bacterium]|nr:hypothetical protein [Chloroflexota bacterium]